jgi:hypothetical protein
VATVAGSAPVCVIVVRLKETVKENVSPSTVPLSMAMGSPCGPARVPESPAPSCLKTKVSEKLLLPLGVYIWPVQAPVMLVAPKTDLAPKSEERLRR